MCQSGLCDECLRDSRVLAGLNGADGADGLSVLSGSGMPSYSLGVDSQYYIDKVAPFNMYLKSAGVWQLLGRLQGVDGNGFLLRSSMTITPTQIATMDGTVGIDLLPALPVGFYYNPIELIMVRDRIGSTPWTAGGGTVYLTLKHTVSATTYFQTSVSILTNSGYFDHIKLNPVPTTSNAISNLGTPFYTGIGLAQQSSVLKLSTNAGSMTGGSFGLKTTITYTIEAV